MDGGVEYDDLFPHVPYEFRIGLRREEPSLFFRGSREAERVCAERRHWLNQTPEECLGVVEGGDALVEATAELFTSWGLVSRNAGLAGASLLAEVSGQIEPDLLLLAPGKDGRMRLLAGCVCFPSSWRLAEKLGRAMESIHEPVPGLNNALSTQVETFLTRLKPGFAWLRQNWGLSASGELNQHPARGLPRLNEDATLETTWLRVERQALLSLDDRGVLFGIRIETEPVAVMKETAPEMARRFAAALRSLTPELAAYKGIASARESLARLLEA